MFLPNLLHTVQNSFAPDKAFNFRVLFPDNDKGTSTYLGKGEFGAGYDPCPYTSWFPAESVDVPVGWFVTSKPLDCYVAQIPIPEAVKFQRISLTFTADRYKKLETWFERWYESMVNGGKHMGTLSEIARPLWIIKTYSNPNQALNQYDSEKGFNLSQFYVVPDGEIIDHLAYKSMHKAVVVNFNIVGKIADERAMNRPKRVI